MAKNIVIFFVVTSAFCDKFTKRLSVINIVTYPSEIRQDVSFVLENVQGTNGIRSATQKFNRPTHQLLRQFF